ncbi:MAG: site-specific DNA-methyltransferase [Acutalibacteraceae bacterium]
MDKLKMQTANKADDNFQKLAALFPNAVTETIDENGEIVRAIDKDVLMQEISCKVVDGNEERYQFTWPDKKKSVLLANAPINKTLRPCREESVDFDNTKNLYIEGDNLEVLKLLQETYLGKIKMIYIDPPYNTGNDFVYEDDFAQSTDEYLKNSGQFDDEGNRLVKNLDTNGRFHTDWLNMIYPRLKLAKDLLSDDGVIFISIDEHELINLVKASNEIFGTDNMVGIFNWAKTETPENLSKKCKQIIEYVVCYQKNLDSNKFKGIKKSSPSSNGLLNQPNSVGILTFPANIVETSIPNGKIKKGHYGTDSYDVELMEDTEVMNGIFIKPVKLRGKFKWQQSYLDEEIKKGTKIRIPTMKFSPSYEKLEYDAEVPANLINSKVNVGTNENAGEHLSELFGKKVFSYPKPTSLIEYLLGFNDCDDEYYVLDFFSGSATTAEAVMNLNAIDGYNKRKFIMVQLPEDLNQTLKTAKSPAQRDIAQNAIDYLNAKKRDLNLCELAKERIILAGKKIQEEHSDVVLDVGFRVLKLDTTNMKDVYYSPDEFDLSLLVSSVDNIKADRTPEDLLFQVMLDLGVELSNKIEESEICGKKVFDVADSYLIACFDENVTEEVIAAIAKKKPYYFVMRDSSAANDSVSANFEQIFANYSAGTIRKIL